MTGKEEGGPLTGDVEAAVTFQTSLNPLGPWTLCAIVPDGALIARTFGSSELDDLRRFVAQHNGHRNLYQHVNPLRDGVRDSKAKKADIKEAHFAHVDIDDLNALTRLAEFVPAPTAVVCSGGGYNVYWRFDLPVPDLPRVERINRWLVEQLDGDPAATDGCRILRTPGTINLPTKTKRAKGRGPSLAYVVDELTDWSRAYDVAEFGERELHAAVPAARQLDTPEITADELPEDTPAWIREIVIKGDDEERPRNSADPRFRSRSEAVFAVTSGLIKFGLEERQIAGILINPSYGISTSILEKRAPLAEALRQAHKAAMKVRDAWPDGVDGRTGVPRRSLQNTQAGFLRLGAEFHFDAFRQRSFVSGHVLQSFEGELSDGICGHLRDTLDKRFHLDPGRDMTREAIETLCRQNVLDPVCEYLANLEWDGTPRGDTWLIDFAGAEDNDYVRAVSAIMLIAAVRRRRQPGVKFDTIPVLEGPQGSGKSTLLKIMASAEFFSDELLLSLDHKAQIEALEGIWIFELGELAGLGNADVNRVKSFASRSVDRARPAYGRFRENRPRRGILVGTTNNDQYLRDETGNRRFWPIRTGAIDLEGLRAVRDQLWAEAAAREAKDESVELAPDLWPIAAIEQGKRLEADGWEPVLERLRGWQFAGKEIITSASIMTDTLDMSPGIIQAYHWKRLRRAMNALGWEGPVLLTLPSGEKAKGYRRDPDPSHDPSEPV